MTHVGADSMALVVDAPIKLAGADTMGTAIDAWLVCGLIRRLLSVTKPSLWAGRAVFMGTKQLNFKSKWILPVVPISSSERLGEEWGEISRADF